MTSILFYESDMILSISGITDDAGDAVTDATVNLTELEDCDGNTPAGITLPLLLSHVADGTYEAQIEESIEVEPGDVYTAKIEVDSTAGDGSWYETIVVRKRKT